MGDANMFKFDNPVEAGSLQSATPEGAAWIARTDRDTWLMYMSYEYLLITMVMLARHPAMLCNVVDYIAAHAKRGDATDIMASIVDSVMHYLTLMGHPKDNGHQCVWEAGNDHYYIEVTSVEGAALALTVLDTVGATAPPDPIKESIEDFKAFYNVLLDLCGPTGVMGTLGSIEGKA